MTSRVIGNPTLFGGVDVRVRVTGSQGYVLQLISESITQLVE